MYGDKDEDGFFWGELNGQAGYIPFNMVSEVELEDEESGSNVTSPSVNVTQESTQPPEESPSQEQEVAPSSSENLLEEVILEEGEFEDPRESDNYQLPPRRMVALFDYDPQTLSPNPDSEVRSDQRNHELGNPVSNFADNVARIYTAGGPVDYNN